MNDGFTTINGINQIRVGTRQAQSPRCGALGRRMSRLGSHDRVLTHCRSVEGGASGAAAHRTLAACAMMTTVVALVLGVAYRGMTAAVPIPGLEQWETRMITLGRARCEYLAGPRTFDELLSATYYDAERVFYQIAAYTDGLEWVAAYTGGLKWVECAKRAEAVYRDRYVFPNGGRIPGYANFTHGLTMDYLRSGNAQSKNAVILLSQNAAYASDYAPLEWTVSAAYSREVAYAIISYINAEKVGAPPRARLPLLVTQALGHLDQWFMSKSFRCPSSCDPAAATGQYYIQPFMVGLTSAALIMYYDKTGDARVLPAVRTAMDWLWANAWVAADESFWYENWVPNPSIPFPPQPGAPDLNLLIAPAFAWLYHQTGDIKYRDQGDSVFAGGAKRAWLGTGKHFNQNYSWSFDYVKWRRGR